MAKRGKIPSLVGGGAGASRFAEARGKRTCKRCDGEIAKGTKCVQVAVPASLGHKTYCLRCFGDILAESRKDLDKRAAQLAALI